VPDTSSGNGDGDDGGNGDGHASDGVVVKAAVAPMTERGKRMVSVLYVLSMICLGACYGAQGPATIHLAEQVRSITPTTTTTTTTTTTNVVISQTIHLAEQVRATTPPLTQTQMHSSHRLASTEGLMFHPQISSHIFFFVHARANRFRTPFVL
jgi:hypothetical protein